MSSSYSSRSLSSALMSSNNSTMMSSHMCEICGKNNDCELGSDLQDGRELQATEARLLCALFANLKLPVWSSLMGDVAV
jgi:hypothetical protein